MGRVGMWCSRTFHRDDSWVVVLLLVDVAVVGEEGVVILEGPSLK